MSVPAGALPRGGKEWKPNSECFVKDKAEWVPDLGVDKQHQRYVI